VHRRHRAKTLELVEGYSAAAAAATDAEAPAAEPAPAKGVTLRQPNGVWLKAEMKVGATEPRKDEPQDDYVQVVWPERRFAHHASDTIGPPMPDEPDPGDPVDAADGGASTDQTPDDADGATGSVQPETRQHARLAHKMGRPLFAIGPTGEVRVLLSRPGLSVYLQPDTLHKLAAASALVRQAGGLA
jgi:hypothetical protein